MLFSSQVALTCSGLFGPESSWPPLLSPTNKERFKCQMRDTRIPLSNQIAQFLFFPQWNSRGEEKKRLQSNRGSVSHRASFPGLLRFIVSSGPNWGALLNPPWPCLPFHFFAPLSSGVRFRQRGFLVQSCIIPFATLRRPAGHSPRASAFFRP